MLFNDKDKKDCVCLLIYFIRNVIMYFVQVKIKIRLGLIFFFEFVFIDFRCIDFLKNFNIGLNVYDMYVFFK